MNKKDTLAKSGLRYPQIEVSGEPRELGRQLGEATREQIKSFAEIALEIVNKTAHVSQELAMSVAEDCVGFVEQYSPEMLDELRGTAEGSGVSMEKLMLLQVRNQLQATGSGGCTAFSVSPTQRVPSHAIVAQNWDNDPALDPFTIVLTRRPTGKPALMNVTQAGLIGYIGLNEAGMGVCLNALPAPSRQVGVPFYFTVRGIYETTSLDEAVAAVRGAHRAIPGNIMMATPQGPADLEVTLNEIRVLRDEGLGFVTHTNHCLHPDLAPINEAFPELIESKPRKQRVDHRLREAGSPLEIEQIKSALSDHDNYPKSICRHPNEHPRHGYWESVFSVIIEADQGRIHVSRGTPCNHPYETYDLN